MNWRHHNYESQNITHPRLWIWRRCRYRTRDLLWMGAVLPFL